MNFDHLKQHYSSLIDEELIRIKLRGELQEEALAFLDNELSKRNIDVGKFAAQREQEIIIHNAKIDKQAAAKKDVEHSISKFAIGLAFMVGLIGVVNAIKSPNDAPIILLLTLVLIAALFLKRVYAHFLLRLSTRIAKK